MDLTRVFLAVRLNVVHWDLPFPVPGGQVVDTKRYWNTV